MMVSWFIVLLKRKIVIKFSLAVRAVSFVVRKIYISLPQNNSDGMSRHYYWSADLNSKFKDQRRRKALGSVWLVFTTRKQLNSIKMILDQLIRGIWNAIQRNKSPLETDITVRHIRVCSQGKRNTHQHLYRILMLVIRRNGRLMEWNLKLIKQASLKLTKEERESTVYIPSFKGYLGSI